MVDLREAVSTLLDIGFYDVILPFILVYAIVFAILVKSRIFEGGSSDSKLANKVSAIVALVFGLLVVTSIQIVSYIQSLIVNVIIVVVFLLCLYVVLGFLLGDKLSDLFENKTLRYVVVITSFIVVLSILLSILGTWAAIGNWWEGFSDRNSSTLGTVLLLGVIGLVLYWVTSSASSDKKTENK